MLNKRKAVIMLQKTESACFSGRVVSNLILCYLSKFECLKIILVFMPDFLCVGTRGQQPQDDSKYLTSRNDNSNLR